MKKNSTIRLVGLIVVMLAVGLTVFTAIIATGSFRMRQTKLVITTGAASKEYDGAPLKSNTWKLVSGKLGKEHSMEVSVVGSQTEVGKGKNIAVVTITDTSGLDVTDQYDIQLEAGDLIVERSRLVFASESDEKVYDGTPLQCTVAYLKNGYLRRNATWEVDEFTSMSDVGVTQNRFVARVLDIDGNDITSNYTIEYEYGTLTVQCGSITITSPSQSKEYDGTPLAVDMCTIEKGSLLPGHTMEAHSLGTITTVGIVSNRIEVKICDENGEDVTNLYEVIDQPGELIVMPRYLILQTLDVTRPYYETPYAEDWKIIGGELADGDKLTVSTAQGAGIYWEPGTYENTVAFSKIYNESGVLVTSCYQLVFQTGTVVLTE
ncbi:MAG: hypothetical protein IJM57_04245 [Lachnospiraceae bacterium]|nr:hypothetical protein [Lachnospiraceae bacterium]